ncbi:hypothetical protein EOI86_08185 [Hwanghaeella grinnelliae]|uniref:Uncharacterized protein n=1 Tax=Hwanghaeella grinnelliae TaxID=2500179 RepID=A0A437QXP0_9PROT|nr:hypothetical protein [Hwanghaeella grinnelliae]RVU39213.1 hypothetical protein EOI86_08185 [Hwanghaeella grinnelliae]
MNLFLRTTVAAALLAAIPFSSALADEVQLDKPEAGATLHGNEVDMSVYFTESENGKYIVVGTYLGKTSQDVPSRFVMELADGEKAQFGLPAKRGSLYVIAREGNRVTVTDLPVNRPHAS